MSHDGDRDDALLLAQGEYARLLAKYEPVIIGRCIARLRGSVDAEDVAQDVKLRLWRELSADKEYGVPFRVVVHQVIGWTIADYFEGRPTHIPLPQGWDSADPANGQAELLDRDAVSSVLDGLEGGIRDAMELRYLQGLEIGEIAARLGIQRGTVDKRLHDGRKKLRETLTRG